MLNSSKKMPILLATVALIASHSMPALAVPVVIQNGFVQAGVNDYGTLGSIGGTPPGILYDKTGLGNYGVNDFLTPGTPFEGYYLTTTPVNGGANNAGEADFGTNSPTLTSATTATWSGSNGYFSITNNYALTILGSQSVIAIESILTNISTVNISSLQFLRTLDPDPDVNAFGSFYTENSRLSGNQACGTGISSGQTICAYSFDAIAHNAGVSAGWSSIPATYLAGVNDGNGDYAIGVAFDIGDIAAGQTVKLTYGYSLGATKEDATGNMPEPNALGLFGIGFASFYLVRRRTTSKNL